jgi:hypothetical protein
MNAEHAASISTWVEQTNERWVAGLVNAVNIADSEQRLTTAKSPIIDGYPINIALFVIKWHRCSDYDNDCNYKTKTVPR